MTPVQPLHIIQVSRRVHPFGGVAGVAFALKAQFDELSVPNSLITVSQSNRKPNSRVVGKFYDFLEVVVFSFRGSFLVQRARGQNTVIINHGDALGGDIYVDHGLHRQVVMEKPSLLLRNPIHVFLYIREELRHRFRTYRYLATLSNFSRGALERYFSYVPPDQVINIPNGVDLRRFSVPREAEDTLQLRLIFVGHEFERKGLRILLEAMSLLPAPVKLSVVGGSTDEIRIHRAVADQLDLGQRVEFLGRRHDIEFLMSKSDALVLPSRFESWQLVALEAMASGAVYIGTPVGCAAEIIEEGINGYLVERSATSIAEKITLLLKSRDRLPEMRRAARATAENYSWRAIAMRYLDLAELVRSQRASHER